MNLEQEKGGQMTLLKQDLLFYGSYVYILDLSKKKGMAVETVE